MPNTILVIPCYNEAARLDTRRFREFVDRSENVDLLLVNDGSTDDTFRILSELCAQANGRMQQIDLSQNAGKAEAVRRGMVAAIKRRPEFVGYWDADLATPLEAVHDFRQVLLDGPELRLVMGSRVALLGRRIERRFRRHLAGRVFATCASCVLGLPIYDTQCGAKLFRVTTETPSLFSEEFKSHWIFDVEILARMIQGERQGHGPPVREIVYELPLKRWRDVAGSKLKLRDFAKATWELVSIWRRYMLQSNNNPQREALDPLPDESESPSESSADDVTEELAA